MISCTILSVTSRYKVSRQSDIAQFGSTRNRCLPNLQPLWEPFFYKRFQSKAIAFRFPTFQILQRRHTWNDVLKINRNFIDNPVHVFTCHHNKCGLAWLSTHALKNDDNALVTKLILVASVLLLIINFGKKLSIVYQVIVRSFHKL